VSVNASYSGSRPIMMRDVIKYVILPGHPKVFLYGIEPRALNSPEPNTLGTDSYLSSPIGYALSQPSEPLRAALLWMVHHSGFIRYRELVKGWLESGKVTLNPAPDDRGFQPLTEMLKGREHLYADAVPFPEANPVQHNAIKEIATDCKDMAVLCIFISMPMSAESYKYILPEDDQVFQQELNRITHETLVPIWNFDTPQCRTLLDSTLFYDLSHLNKSGAQKFSVMLATLYLEQIEQSPIEGEVGTDCVQIIKP
jgi:hypothetical protein